MSDLIKILQEADTLSLAVEQSRQNFEASKAALEKSKNQLEEAQANLNTLLSQSEDAGIPKSKLKKLIEERTQSLLASGLWLDSDLTMPKTAKAPRKKVEKPLVIESHAEDEVNEAATMEH